MSSPGRVALKGGLTVGGSAASIQGLRPYGDWQSQCAYPVLPAMSFIRFRKQKQPIPSQFPLVFGVRLGSGEYRKAAEGAWRIKHTRAVLAVCQQNISGNGRVKLRSGEYLKESAGGSVH